MWQLDIFQFTGAAYLLYQDYIPGMFFVIQLLWGIANVCFKMLYERSYLI